MRGDSQSRTWEKQKHDIKGAKPKQRSNPKTTLNYQKVIDPYTPNNPKPT